MPAAAIPTASARPGAGVSGHRAPGCRAVACGPHSSDGSRAHGRPGRSREEVLALAGRDLGPSDWLPVEQDRVDAFATVVDDWHWAHNDPARAGQGPFGRPIIHAHLTLTMGVHLLGTVLAMADGTDLMFYGYDRVRFPTIVPVGDRIRWAARVAEVDDVGGGEQLTLDFRIEVEGQERPGCVGRSIWRHYPVAAPDRPREPRSGTGSGTG